MAAHGGAMARARGGDDVPARPGPAGGGGGVHRGQGVRADLGRATSARGPAQGGPATRAVGAARTRRRGGAAAAIAPESKGETDGEQEEVAGDLTGGSFCAKEGRRKVVGGEGRSSASGTSTSSSARFSPLLRGRRRGGTGRDRKLQGVREDKSADAEVGRDCRRVEAAPTSTVAGMAGERHSGNAVATVNSFETKLTQV